VLHNGCALIELSPSTDLRLPSLHTTRILRYADLKTVRLAYVPTLTTVQLQNTDLGNTHKHGGVRGNQPDLAARTVSRCPDTSRTEANTALEVLRHARY
jgi:hypothetical protein